MLANSELSGLERSWLESLFLYDFPVRDGIIRQINNAKITRDYTDGYYLSMRFHVDKSEEPIEVETRIPVEMEVFEDGAAPIAFLLHVIDGYVDELEIYNEYGEAIQPNLVLDGKRIKWVYDRRSDQ